VAVERCASKRQRADRKDLKRIDTQKKGWNAHTNPKTPLVEVGTRKEKGGESVKHLKGLERWKSRGSPQEKMGARQHPEGKPTRNGGARALKEKRTKDGKTYACLKNKPMILGSRER